MDLVIAADNMDYETFALHMTRRHHESLGGLTTLVLRKEDGITQAYRSFHRKLHEWRVDLGHEHQAFARAQAAAG